MKKYLVLLCLVSLFGTSMRAFQETGQKMVIRINGVDFSWDLKFSEEGLLSGIYDGYEENGQLLWSYDYHVSIDGSSYIRQNGFFRPDDDFYYTEGDPTFIRESKLDSDGLISKDNNGNTFMWSTGESFEYEYDGGRMVKITGMNGIVAELSWMEGNLAHIVFLENNEKVGEISCLYSSLPAKGICMAVNSPLLLLLDYYNIQPLGPLAHGYYGSLNQNLLTEMAISYTDKFVEDHSGNILSSSYYPITKRASRKYSYLMDADGNIASIMVNEDNYENVYSFKYKNNSTDVKKLFFNVDNHNCFDLQGRQQQGKPARGVYIRDGRKVVIK